ncbi:unnamed protein product [Linum trigynum]|uniref:Uncharacterized protein n=1 Tax=Linum trigynum TaxID=586398 RepID=A0AAV2F7P1_9ROSI
MRGKPLLLRDTLTEKDSFLSKVPLLSFQSRNFVPSPFGLTTSFLRSSILHSSRKTINYDDSHPRQEKNWAEQAVNPPWGVEVLDPFVSGGITSHLLVSAGKCPPIKQERSGSFHGGVTINSIYYYGKSVYQDVNLRSLRMMCTLLAYEYLLSPSSCSH